MTRPRRPAAFVALLVGALTLAACTGTPEDPPTPQVTDPMPAVPEALTAYYDQELTWQDCGDGGVECTDVLVPLDYDDPAGADITLAVQRLRADGAAIGSLLINPGGPGSPATDLLAAAPTMFSADLLAAYDVVAVDPRGVGGSTPVDCVSDPELDVILSGTSGTSDADGIAEYQAEATELAAECAASTGPLITEVDTVSAARDMDVVRHLLGEARLDYLGFSYGTYLGAVYAETFPDRMGNFVLDGAMDPRLGLHETTLAQAVGFEKALHAYVADCLEGAECPLSGSVDDGVGQVATLLDVTADTPLPTSDGRELTSSLAFSGISLPLYQSEIWFLLSQALAQAMNEGDGSMLLYLADLYAGRATDGTYASNTVEANWAINCLDYGGAGDPATWEAEAAELAEAAPTFGPLLAYGGVLCAEWPGDPVGNRGAAITAAGAPPIMVVGTTGDPATPYEWSVALADQLASGFLVTYEGEGHTAYGRSNECVTAAVDAFLIDGAVPEEGLTC
ncbi:MAG: alpha/beta hydrolase [Georgenia sp.]